MNKPRYTVTAKMPVMVKTSSGIPYMSSSVITETAVTKKDAIVLVHCMVDDKMNDVQIYDNAKQMYV